MESSINLRIKEIIEKTNNTVNSFSKKIGIAQTSLRECVINGAEPKYTTLSKILIAEPLISAEWLLRGEGEMLLDEATKKDVPTSSSDSDKDEEIKLLKEENLRLEKEVSYLEGKISVLIDDRTPREKDEQEGESA